MKKWENPQLSFLGIEKTKSVVCPICDGTTYAKDPEKNQHYCHRDNIWHQNNCMSLQQGHVQSAKCPTGGNHEWAGQPHKSKCCCGGVIGGDTGGDNVGGLS